VAVPESEIKLLNLIRSSPSFVLWMNPPDAGATVKRMDVVPADTGVYWVAGVTIASGGRELESAFAVDSSGGELISVFWFVDGRWIQSTDDAALHALGLERNQVFPFDWRFAVPFECDFFHHPPDLRRPRLP
jgi:hypothetical protein